MRKPIEKNIPIHFSHVHVVIGSGTKARAYTTSSGTVECVIPENADFSVMVEDLLHELMEINIMARGFGFARMNARENINALIVMSHDDYQEIMADTARAFVAVLPALIKRLQPKQKGKVCNSRRK